MKESKVALVRCAGYDAESLPPSLSFALDLIGGLGAFLKRGDRVFVKVNHLSPDSAPDEAIYTHPVFVREVLRLLASFDVDITVGDDTNSGQGDRFLSSGYRQACADLRVRLINLKEAGFTEVLVQGKVLRRAYVARPVLEADVLVNLPKLKTHSFTAFTGAVKNMFGVIPHGLRLDCHRRFVRSEVFSQMLVDLFSRVRPQLTIMDAVVAMEGEGPSSGAPRPVGLILAGRDAVAVDAVATRIIGYDPLRIYTTSYAHQRGLGSGSLDRIEIAGADIKSVEVKDFRRSAVAIGLLQQRLPAFLYAYFQSQLTLTPEVAAAKCTACLRCLDICPVQAISLFGKAARVEEKKCIHCLCCHEVCRFQAVRLKQRPLGKLMRTASHFYNRVTSDARS